MDIVRKINSGLKNWKNQLNFFSPENHDPDFTLAIREDFDENIDGIYRANILKAFDTKDQAELNVAFRRNVLPLNYYHQRDSLDDGLDATIGGAFDINSDHSVKLETTRVNSLDDTVVPSDYPVFFFLHIYSLIAIV